MPTLRSSKRCQGPQGFNVSPMKSTRKVKKGRISKKKVAFATSTVGQSEVSSAPLPTLPVPEGFGSLVQNPTHLTGYVAQAARVVHNISLPASFSGNVDQWPHYSRTIRDYIRAMLGRRDIDLMSEEGYDAETEEKIYEYLCQSMDHKEFNRIDARYNDQGTKAFRFLDTFYRGTKQMRAYKCVQRFTTICYIWGESPTDYVAELTRLVQESATLGIHTLGAANSLASYISTQTAKLPRPHLEHLQERLQLRYLKHGYPTEIADFTSEFTYEINRLKENGLFANTTRVSVAAAAEVNLPSYKNPMKKRKKKLQVSNANAAPIPPPPQIQSDMHLL